MSGAAAYIGDIADPDERDTLLQSAGLPAWAETRRQLPEPGGGRRPTPTDGAVRKRRARARPKRQDLSREDVEQLMGNRGGGLLGSSV